MAAQRDPGKGMHRKYRDQIGQADVNYGWIWGHFQSSSLGHLSLLSVPLFGRARRFGGSAACALFGSMLQLSRTIAHRQVMHAEGVHMSQQSPQEY